MCVGAGDGPCVILMVGARSEDGEILYPVSELAARYGAGVEHGNGQPQRGVRTIRATPAGQAIVLGSAPMGVAVLPSRRTIETYGQRC